MNTLTIKWNNKKVQLPLCELAKVCLEIMRKQNINEVLQTARAMELQSKVLKSHNTSIGIYTLTLSEEL
jgi:hypothetical protein